MNALNALLIMVLCIAVGEAIVCAALIIVRHHNPPRKTANENGSPVPNPDR